MSMAIVWFGKEKKAKRCSGRLAFFNKTLETNLISSCRIIKFDVFFCF